VTVQLYLNDSMWEQNNYTICPCSHDSVLKLYKERSLQSKLEVTGDSPTVCK
jgi:hypothetical protein